MSNQSLKQASIRAVTGTTGTYEEDWHALFDLAGISGGAFNERLLAYINYKLSSSYNNLPSAMQAFAADNGAYNWDSLGTFDASEGDGSLADVVASAVFDLDATIAASYPGSGQTWANLVAAPADGSAQTAYDFFRGDGSTSTTYPTFTGSAGDSAAYWSFDGGDYFQLLSGVNTPFIRDLHKTTAAKTFWVAITMLAVDPPGTRHLFSNAPSGSAHQGVSLQIAGSGNGRFKFQQGDGLVGTNNLDLGSASFSANNQNHILIFSYDSATNTARHWVDTDTAIETSFTYLTAITDAAGILRIGTVGGGTINPVPSGTRIYSVAMGNEYLDNTKAAAIIAALEARHGRDYTP